MFLLHISTYVLFSSLHYRYKGVYTHLISNVPLLEPGQVRNFGRTFAGGDGANFAHIAEKRTEVEI